jgi:GxxExxY protein
MIITKQYVNDIAYGVVGCAIEVHKYLGPGLLESIYHRCLMQELSDQGFDARASVPVPIVYKGTKLADPLVVDILVNDLVLVELKAVEVVLPVHQAQLLSYVRLTEKPKGLLINFHTDNITKSLIPIVGQTFAKLPES